MKILRFALTVLVLIMAIGTLNMSTETPSAFAKVKDPVAQQTVAPKHSFELKSPSSPNSLTFTQTLPITTSNWSRLNAVGGDPEGRWAVGFSGDFPRQVLINYWNGSAWSAQSYSGLTPVDDEELNGVTGGSSTGTAVAVGASGNFYSGDWQSHNLVLNYNGTTWSSTSSPNCTSATVWADQLNAVDQVSSGNWFAVGQWTPLNDDYPTYYSLVMHNFGSGWKLDTDCNSTAAPYFLRAVSGKSTSDVWAAGVIPGIGGGNVIGHYNGSTWTWNTSVPNPGTDDNELYGITEVSSNDVWAVGVQASVVYPSAVWSGTVLHWDGTSWTDLSSHLPRTHAYLYAVDSTSGGYVWAAGAYEYAGANTAAPWIVQLDGTTYPEYTNLPGGETRTPNNLTGITINSPGDIAAVGWDVPQTGSNTANAYQSLSTLLQPGKLLQKALSKH